MGHAVALERAASFGPWHVPEQFPAALCVPVSSPTIPLGTLWLFSEREREFTSPQSQFAEMTAGRLAAELERSVLIAARVESAEAARQIEAAARLQHSQRPQPIRLAAEGWELAGRTTKAGTLGGAFYDWCWLPGDALAIAIGEAGQTGIAGALTAAALRSAVRTLTEEGIGPAQLLARVNRSLWLTSGGDESASLWLAIVELSSGRMQYAWAGAPAVIRLASATTEIALPQRPPLGMTTDVRYVEQVLELAPAETLFVASRDLARLESARHNGGYFAALAECLSPRQAGLAASDFLKSLDGSNAEESATDRDCAVVALKRLE